MTGPALPRPSFIDRDPIAVEAELVAQFEALTGRTLQPAQVERQLLSVLAYRETLLRVGIQNAAEQTLVSYAIYPMLDYLGEIVGVTRLAAIAAVATVRFTLTGVQGANVVIPAGTRVRSLDGAVIFATNADVIIAPGDTIGDVDATAATAGALGNGYIAGNVSELLDPIGAVASAANTGTTAGGSDLETDARLRDRIRTAPEMFSVAGSIGAYRHLALAVSGAIIDVSVNSPAPGEVRVVVLTASGLPSPALLDAVLAALSAETVRPLTDSVTVIAPTRVTYDITATISTLLGFDATQVLAAAQAAVDAFAADRRAVLGRSIVPSAIIAALSVPGVYQVQLSAPAFADLAQHEWADCTAITLTLGAANDG